MDFRQLKAYIRPLGRWWWLILGTVVIAAVAAGALVRMRDPVYVTTGLVMVGNSMQELNPDSQQIAITRGLAETYVRLAQYGPLRDATKEALQLEWLPEYSITLVPNSQLIQITVTDTDPQRVWAVANELIRQLTALSPGSVERQQRQEFAEQQIQMLEAGIRQTEASIADLQSQLSEALSARQILQIEERMRAQEAKLDSVRSYYIGLLQTTSEGSSNTIALVNAPSVPTIPVQSNDLLLILVAGLLGAAIAIAGAYLLDTFDNQLRDVQELREAYGVVTLGSIPENSSEKVQGPLIMLRDPHTMAAESFRVLRTNLIYASVDRKLNTLLITSPEPGDGKSYVSANLAAAFAQTEQRVVLVDADMRKPTLHRLFGLLNNAGITTALLGDQTAIKNALQPTSVPGLFVMTSGPLPPNPSELLTSNRMNEMLKQLGTMFDLVVVDSPPVTVVSDSAVLGGRVDGVLLVLSSDNLGREMIKRSIGALAAVNAPLLGTVINRVESDGLGFYYSYNAGYGNRYYKSTFAQNPREVPKPPSETIPSYMKPEVVAGHTRQSRLFVLKPDETPGTRIEIDKEPRSVAEKVTEDKGATQGQRNQNGIEELKENG